MYATTLFLSLSLFFCSFFLRGFISFSTLAVRSRYRGDISVSRLNGSDLYLLGQRVFRETVYRISLGGLAEVTGTRGNTGETGPVDATELMAAVAPPSRAVELNAYLREKQRKINIGVFRVSAETTGRFVRIRTRAAGEEGRPSAANR